MTAPTGMRSGAGFRSCTLFALDELGLPNAQSSSTPYEGVKLSAAKVFTYNDPEPRKIYTPGDDSIVAADQLPPQEGASGELHTGKLNDIVDALITGTKAFSVGDIAMFGSGTDMRGYEPNLGLLAYQHAPDTDVDAGTSGLSGWNGIVLPQCRIFQRQVGFNDQPADHPYSVMPMIVAKHLWGPAFTVAVEGFTRLQAVRTYSRGRPKLIAWRGDATEDNFVFPLIAPPTLIIRVKVFVAGILASPQPTITLTDITFSAPPADKANITVLYEY